MALGTVSNQHVFISYARADGDDNSNQIYNALYQERFSVWRDQRNIKPYQDFSVAIERAIRKASHVLVCLTPSIVKRDDSFVRREIIYAQNQKRPIIPLLFAGFSAQDVPILISHLTYIDFGDFGEGFNKLLEHLRRRDVDYEPPVLPDDPFRHHVEQLNNYMISELEQMVNQSKIILLHSEDQPGAVEKILPIAYRVKKMHFYHSPLEPKHFDNFQEAFAHHDQRMLLLGEPGSGKTTTLYAFAREKANERLANPTALLPVYAPIRTWNGSQPLIEWISSTSALDSVELQAEINSERALLLLDGLDELGVDAGSERSLDWRAKFIQQLTEFANTPLLITSRTKDYDDVVGATDERLKLNGAVTLNPLSPDQVRMYLEEDHPHMLRALQGDKDLFAMAQNPLLLTLLAVAFQGETSHQKLLSNLNSSRAEWRDTIFSSYVERRYEFERCRDARLPFSLEEIYAILGQAATNLVRSRKLPDENELDISVFEDLASVHAKNFVEFAQRLHYLRSARPEIYRFIHLLLRDHFAIRYLQPRARSDDKDLRRDAQRTLRLLNAATINVFISHSRESTQHLPVIQDILNRNGISSVSTDIVRPGEDFPVKIGEAIRRSDYMIVLIDRYAATSRYIQDEISLAFGQNKTIIPILLEETELPRSLREVQHTRISLFEPDKERLERELIGVIFGDDKSSMGSQVYLRNTLRRYERFSSSSVNLSVRMISSRQKTSLTTFLAPQSLEQHYDHPWRLLLLGKPGSGKTTAIRQLVVDFARRALRDPFALIPILITVDSFLLSGNENFDTVISEVVNRQQWDDYNLKQSVVLIDGINELLPQQLHIVLDWINHHPELSTLIATRPPIPSEWAPGFSIIELLPPSDAEIRKLIFRRYTPNEADRFWQWLSSAPWLLELSRQPITLTILLSAYQSAPSLPPTEVMPQFLIEQSLASVATIVPQKLLAQFLSLVADEMRKTGKRFISKNRASDLFEPIDQNELTSFDHMVRAALQSGIFSEGPEGFSFSHIMFLEYFTTK